MPSIDLIVIVAYVAGILAFGAAISRRHRDVRDYFVGHGSVPWWAISGSIVATETSTISLISVPGYAFTGDLTFLQLALGLLAGRVIVAAIFVPAYIRGELLTVYQLLGERFGGAARRLASTLFLVTRSLADGLRLFATGLVLAALLRAVPGAGEALAGWLPGLGPDTSLLVVSMLIPGVATILYTYYGGMLAVIWTDVAQLIVYLGGAVLAAWLLVDAIPGGWSGMVEAAQPAGKLRLLDFTADLTRGYTFWSAVIGGAFLTMATHGTDQLIVQRYLCSRTAREAQLALVASGVVVFLQFALFLAIGILLFAYYQAFPQELLALAPDGRVPPDRVLPAFIATELPSGARGLVVAGVFAAAMSTLSSSLNSSSAALIADFYQPATRGRRSDAHYLTAARVVTAVFGIVQIGVALAAISLSSRVIDEALGIASFTNGVVLGMFLLGTFTAVGQRAALAGVAAGALSMLAIRVGTALHWQWYVLAGAGITVLAGVVADRVAPQRGGSR